MSEQKVILVFSAGDESIAKLVQDSASNELSPHIRSNLEFVHISSAAGLMTCIDSLSAMERCCVRCVVLSGKVALQTLGESNPEKRGAEEEKLRVLREEGIPERLRDRGSWLAQKLAGIEFGNKSPVTVVYEDLGKTRDIIIDAVTQGRAKREVPGKNGAGEPEPGSPAEIAQKIAAAPILDSASDDQELGSQYIKIDCARTRKCRDLPERTMSFITGAVKNRRNAFGGLNITYPNQVGGRIESIIISSDRLPDMLKKLQDGLHALQAELDRKPDENRR